MPSRVWPQLRNIDTITVPFGVTGGRVFLDYRFEPLLEPVAGVIATALRRNTARDEAPITDAAHVENVDIGHASDAAHDLSAGLRNWHTLSGVKIARGRVSLCMFNSRSRALALREQTLCGMLDAAHAIQTRVDSGALPGHMKAIKVDSALRARFPRVSGPKEVRTLPTPAWFWSEIARLRGDVRHMSTLLARKSRHTLAALYWTHQQLAHYLARSRHSVPGLSDDAAYAIATWAVMQGEAYYEEVLTRRLLLPGQAPATQLARLIEQTHHARYAARLPDERAMLNTESEITFAERCLLDHTSRAAYRVMTIEYLTDAIEKHIDVADERLCIALALLLEDDTPVVCARFACVAEMRWLAARALAAQRRALGDAALVRVRATQPQALSTIASALHARDSQVDQPGSPRSSSPANLIHWYALERERGALPLQHFEF